MQVEINIQSVFLLILLLTKLSICGMIRYKLNARSDIIMRWNEIILDNVNEEIKDFRKNIFGYNLYGVETDNIKNTVESISDVSVDEDIIIFSFESKGVVIVNMVDDTVSVQSDVPKPSVDFCKNLTYFMVPRFNEDNVEEIDRAFNKLKSKGYEISGNYGDIKVSKNGVYCKVSIPEVMYEAENDSDYKFLFALISDENASQDFYDDIKEMIDSIIALVN